MEHLSHRESEKSRSVYLFYPEKYRVPYEPIVKTQTKRTFSTNAAIAPQVARGGLVTTLKNLCVLCHRRLCFLYGFILAFESIRQ